ncbi:hypothetical protein LGQ03_07245 [Loktanella sp. TSTF-M6]|uniref:Uncharacterized protein n=1 Tax=Loktanella gaetbuli TaxID=2881335 RepID=A0ABS8BTJ7_9RHOB|nr:hypothetical protein [Loktanella gaetbuli]MCB5199031.1 hypothetical protein [Loktanella gaetbuli]
MISIADNIDEFQRGLSDFARNQLPFAVSQALNDTVGEVEEAWRVQLQRRLDNPTPFTLRGTFKQRSSKTRLTASVAFRDIQSSYLRRLVTGGTRLPRNRALLMPVGQRTNKYGNMPRGAVKRVLAKPNVFSGKVNGVGGIWQRPARRAKGGKPKLLIAFRPQARYAKQLDLQRPAEGRARTAFPTRFGVRFRAAIASAR